MVVLLIAIIALYGHTKGMLSHAMVEVPQCLSLPRTLSLFPVGENAVDVWHDGGFYVAYIGHKVGEGPQQVLWIRGFTGFGLILQLSTL